MNMETPPRSTQASAPSRPTGHDAVGFTLVEVIFCMAIFAVGFLVVAMMLPTGALMQKDLLARTDAAIVGKNSLAVVRAKGLYSGANEWMVRIGGTTTYSTNGWWSWGALPGCVQNINNMSALVPSGTGYTWIKDMEHVATSNANALLASVSSVTGLQKYWDTNGGGTSVRDRWGYLRPGNWEYGTYLGPYSFSNGGGYGASGQGGDITVWGEGRINCFKNRPIPGVTPGFFSPGDFSYPSSVFDVPRRSYVSYVHLADRSMTSQNGDGQYKQYTTHDWYMLATTMAIPASGSLSPAPWNPAVKGWPEQVEWDLQLIDQITDSDPTHVTRHVSNPGSVPDYQTAYPHWRMSNCGGAMRWAGTPQQGDPQPANLIRGVCGRYNSRIRDWNGILAPGVRSVGWGGWDHYGLSCDYFYGFPIRDASQTAYDWRGAYVSPVPMDVLAIVYDKDKDLLLLRYPQGFARVRDDDGSLSNPSGPPYTGGGANPRLTGVNGGVFPAGTDWVDRRLTVGDHLITMTGGFHLQVAQVLDEVAAGQNLPATRGGPQDWSDGTYQLVKVTPSLRQTNLSNNVISTVTDWPSSDEWNRPYLYRVIVGTPPVTGGPNPMQSVEYVPLSGRNCGGVMRMDDDLCN